MENNYIITHHGVLGMKWGVRRSKAQLARSRKKSDLDDAHEDYKRAHSGKKMSSMSDQELRTVNNRLNMEKQYKDLTKKTSKGKKAVNAFIASGATVAGIMTAVAAYQKLGKKIGSTKTAQKAIDKIGDVIVKDIKIGKLTD